MLLLLLLLHTYLEQKEKKKQNEQKLLVCKPVAEIAQLGERQTEDLKVPGSNPESSHEL